MGPAVTHMLSPTHVSNPIEFPGTARTRKANPVVSVLVGSRPQRQEISPETPVLAADHSSGFETKSLCHSFTAFASKPLHSTKDEDIFSTEKAMAKLLWCR